MNPDAPEFVPSFREGVPLAASAAAVHVKPITIMLDREVRVFPMREPRTKSLEDDVLHWIGTRVTGSTPSIIGFGGGEESVYAGEPSPFVCDQTTEEDDKVYAYGCHDNDYRLSECLRSMPGFADPTPEQLGDFPKNIQHYYWISDGKRDEHPWRALVRLSTGLFVYITASCAFSGFDCQGGIHVYGATSLQTLVDHGMAEDARQRFARIFNRPSKMGGGASGSQLNRPSKMGGGAAAGGGGGGGKPKKVFIKAK
jgi:hypothetical protein